MNVFNFPFLRDVHCFPSKYDAGGLRTCVLLCLRLCVPKSVRASVRISEVKSQNVTSAAMVAMATAIIIRNRVPAIFSVNWQTGTLPAFTSTAWV